MPRSLLYSTQDGKLSALNKKIVEVKKKIQLSEGQRKANFEECNAKKNDNLEKIINLKKDIKEQQGAAIKNNEISEGAACMSHEPFRIERNKSWEAAIITYDEINTRLRKKIDWLKSLSEKQQHQLTNILREHKDLTSGKARKYARKRLEYPVQKKIISLENQLHRLSVMQMEADTVKKKYISVQSSLKTDAACYASTLQKLEENTKETELEIKLLKKAKEESVHLREITKETLMKQEIAAMNTSRDHDTTIMDYRKRVEERKIELERLERIMFPIVRPTPRDNLDTLEKVDAQEDLHKISQRDDVLELKEIFIKLRSAAGATKTENVLKRFLGQRVTREILQNMRTTTEHEKICLERKRQQLSTEVEMQKFSETENTDQSIEDLENITRCIAKERLRRKKVINMKQKIDKLFNEISKTVCKSHDKLQKYTTDVMESEVQNMLAESTVILEILKDGFINKIDNYEVLDTCFIVEEKFAENPEGLSKENEHQTSKVKQDEVRPLFPLFHIVMTPGTASQQPPSEDEDEIPSRTLLKRQAQLLVDTKSRRKGFTFKR